MCSRLLSVTLNTEYKQTTHQATARAKFMAVGGDKVAGKVAEIKSLSSSLVSK